MSPAAPPARRRPPGATEQAFIDAATVLFADQGYHGTSIGDLAKELGLTTASLYYYVDGKHDRLFRVLQSTTETLLTGLDDISALDVPAGEKLRLAVSSRLDLVLDNPKAVAVPLRERRFLADEQHGWYTERLDAYEQLFSDILEQAMADGDIPPGDTALLRLFSLGSINWFFEWWEPDGRLDRDEPHAAILELILRRLLGLQT